MKTQLMLISLCAFIHGLLAFHSFPMVNEFLHTPIFFSSGSFKSDQTGSIFIMAPIWVVAAMFSFALAMLPTFSTSFILTAVRFSQPKLISTFTAIPYISVVLLFSAISLGTVALITQINLTPFLMVKFPSSALKSVYVLAFISTLLSAYMLQRLTHHSSGTG